MPVITIGTLTEQHRVTLAIIGKLTDDRNANIQQQAERKMGYKDLLVSVYEGTRTQAELDHHRAEMQRLSWIIENEPVSQAIAVFHQKAQDISRQMESFTNQDRVVAAELKYRKQFNLVLSTDKINSFRDWAILESDYQRYHWADLQKLKELRSSFNIVPEDVRAKGFVDYATGNGCAPYNLDFDISTIHLPRG